MHVQKTTGISGSERHLLSLLPALASRGVEVVMVVLAAGESQRFVEAMLSAGVEAVSIPAGPDVNPMAGWQLLAEIRRRRPNLVHTHLIHADLHGQAAARFAGVGGISTVHSTHKFYGRQPYRSLAALAYRNTRATVAISKHVADMLCSLKLATPGRVRVVPYGLDSGLFVSNEQERKEARAHFGVDDSVTTVGMASRLIANKGHEFLIEGMAAAQARGVPLQLLVAGDGPLRSDLERLAADRLVPGTWKFVGFVADVRRFLAASDIGAFLTQPALSEGFGLAALETMAAGIPVVVTDMGPLPELVEDGNTGFVVPPTSVDALSTALVTLACDHGRRARLGERAHLRAKEKFGLDRMVSSTVEVYEEALGA